MNFMLGILGCSAALLLATACGGSTTGGDGAGNNAGGPCTVTAGTYTIHLVAEPGGTNCGPIPDETFTLNGTETDTGGSSVGPSDGGAGCTTTVASATCTVTQTCTFSGAGYTSTDTTSYTFTGDSASGTEVTTEVLNGTSSSCTYDLTITKS